MKKSLNKKSVKSESIENQFLATIVKDLPASIYWKDIEGTYLGCNDFMLDMAGTEKVVGKTDFELPWKAQADEIRKNDLAVLKAQKTLELEESPLLASGKKIVMLTRKTPLKDDQGNIIGILGVSLNVTESKKLETALKKIHQETQDANIVLQQAKEQAELTLDNILANMPGHVYWKDLNGKYLGCNDRQAKSLGFRSGIEIVGKTDFDLPWGNAVASKFRKNDLQIIKTGKAEILEEEAQVDGKKAIVLSQKTPLINKQGDIVGVLGISIDITERKQFELALQEAKEKAEIANKAKTEFLENMRHDIRTPLAGIVGVADIISAEIQDETLKSYIDKLNTSSYALLNLLNEILDTVKLNSGEIPLLKRQFNLKQILTEVINLNSAQAQHKKIDLTFNYDETIPAYLVGDYIRIHRMALELIANSLNFTHQGSVQLTTELAKNEDGYVVIKIIVQDTGIGIPTHQQQEIYLQFKRLTPSFEGIYKGAGLGLAMVKQFINDVKGEIYVESELNKGTKFICVIPLKKSLLDEPLDKIALPIKPHDKLIPEVNPVKSKNETKDKVKTSTKSKILVVEDSPIAASLVEKIIVDLGYQAELAKDGEKAVRLAKKNHYGLIFMDIGLPKLNGFEATKQIRQHPLNQNTPIIALTAHVDQDNKQQYFAAGMNMVLNKPLSKPQAANIFDDFIKNDKQSKQLIDHPTAKIIDLDYVAKHFRWTKEYLYELFSVFLENYPPIILISPTSTDEWLRIQHEMRQLKADISYLGALALVNACAALDDAISAAKTELYNELYKKIFVEVGRLRDEIKNKYLV